MEGLDALEVVLTNLTVQGNPSLVNLDALHRLTQLGGVLQIDDNASLQVLDGLEGIVAVHDLQIRDNQALLSLDGLQKLSSVSGNLWITDNLLLTSGRSFKQYYFAGRFIVYTKPAGIN